MRLSVAAFLLLTFARHSSAAELVWLDGHRETVRRVVVRKDRVLVSFEKGLRSISKRKLVKVIGDDGKEIALDRRLREGAPKQEHKAALASMAGVSADRLRPVQDRLADSMNRMVMEGLIEFCTAKESEVRARAATTLLLMGVDESIRAGLVMTLGDKDKAVRLRLASALLGVSGALKAGGFADDVAKGLKDKHPTVKATFALVLSRLGDERAIPVLKTAGLRNRDHHIRESSAEALAELGDDAGAGVLIGMLSRTRHPAAGLPERLVVKEKVRVCGHLARLRTKRAIAALKKAARSKHEELAQAAQRALDAIVE